MTVGTNPAVTETAPPDTNVYQKGISLTKEAMQAVEAQLERNPALPKRDILIRPNCLV